jgi:hypothetical protein
MPLSRRIASSAHTNELRLLLYRCSRSEERINVCNSIDGGLGDKEMCCSIDEDYACNVIV